MPNILVPVPDDADSQIATRAKSEGMAKRRWCEQQILDALKDPPTRKVLQDILAAVSGSGRSSDEGAIAVKGLVDLGLTATDAKRKVAEAVGANPQAEAQALIQMVLKGGN